MEKDYLNKIEKICNDICLKQGLTLVSVKENNDPELGKLLTILIDKDFDITMDEIEKFTDTVNPLIDEIGEPDTSYTLDIASGGSEREIEFEMLDKLISHYLDIKLKKTGEVKTMMLDEVKDDKIILHHFVKGKKTKVELSKDDILNIHMGYKA